MFNFISDIIDFASAFISSPKQAVLWFIAFIVLVGIYLAMQGKL